MSVIVKCDRPYGKKELRRMIESCGCCPPLEPQCPPCPPSCEPIIYSPPCSTPHCSPPTICCPPPNCPVPCCPPTSCPPLPCSPRPFICPPCCSYPCVTCASIPKPVPTPPDYGPVIRTRVSTGGLFYTGTIKCYPCSPCPPPVRCP